MTQERFEQLKPGDWVKNVGSGRIYVIRERFYGLFMLAAPVERREVERKLLDKIASVGMIVTPLVEVLHPEHWEIPSAQ